MYIASVTKTISVHELRSYCKLRVLHLVVYNYDRMNLTIIYADIKRDKKYGHIHKF